MGSEGASRFGISFPAQNYQLVRARVGVQVSSFLAGEPSSLSEWQQSGGQSGIAIDRSWADNRLIDLPVTAGPGELLRVLSERRSLVLCRFNVLVQAQAAVRALTQTLGSPSDLRDRWPPSCLWASAHDGDVGELSKTPAASRTTHQSKQLRSVYPHQGHTE
jgi:hypothetical protein